MRLPKLALYNKILLGFVIGIVAGVAANQFGQADFFSSYIKPFGTAFIRLISMVVVPLVFASLKGEIIITIHRPDAFVLK
jgi:Na+/H+-dicarboxylate symporter